MVQKFLAIIAAYGDENLYADIKLALGMIKLPVSKDDGNLLASGNLQEFFSNHQMGRVYRSDSCTGAIYCSALYTDRSNKPASLALLIDPTASEIKNALDIFFADGLYHLLYYGGHGSSEGWWVESDAGEEVSFPCTYFSDLRDKKRSFTGEVHLNCCDASEWVNNVVPTSGGSGALLQLAANNPALSRGIVNAVHCKQDSTGLRYYALKQGDVPIKDSLNPFSEAVREHFNSPPRTHTVTDFAEVAEGYRASTALRTLVDPPPAPAHNFALYSFRSENIGDCFLLCSEEGRCNILIDGNRKSHFKTTAWPLLGAVGKFHLVLGTHSDRDHMGGLVSLTAHCPELIEQLWVNHRGQSFRNEADVENVVRNWLKYRAGQLVPNTKSGDRFVSESGNTKLLVISPTKDLYKAKCEKTADGPAMNDISIISVIYNGDVPKVLIPGDSSAKILLSQLAAHGLQDVTFELLVLPHHGSKDSNKLKVDGADTWLHRKVKAKRIIINGRNAGHPSADLCYDLDEMLDKDPNVRCFVAHRDWQSFFPKAHAKGRVEGMDGMDGIWHCDLP